ncbi:MAG: DUF4411 family protein [Candidatus Humimicrobiaceae bacterium]
MLSEKFLNAKMKSQQAEPWIIAQAKIKKFTVITDEVTKDSNIKYFYNHQIKKLILITF